LEIAAISRGRNIGFFSLLATSLIGHGGHVTAFEADPEIAARLREHVARSKLSWMISAALGALTAA